MLQSDSHSGPSATGPRRRYAHARCRVRIGGSGALNPAGVQIRIAGDNENPLFCLADVCQALGYKDVSKAAREWADEIGKTRLSFGVGHTKTQKEGRPTTYDKWYCREGDLYRVILQSGMPVAEEFTKWVCDEVLPCIRQHGQYPALAQPVEVEEENDTLTLQIRSLLDMRLRQVAMERQQRAIVQQVETVTGQVQVLTSERDQAKLQLEHVDRSDSPPPDKTLRARVNEILRAYCRATGVPHEDAWRKLYHEMYYRCSFDARARAKNSGRSKIEEIERAGMLGDLYAIASEVLDARNGAISPVPDGDAA